MSAHAFYAGKFDPDQPRANDGRWSAVGAAAGAAGRGALDAAQAAYRTARDHPTAIRYAATALATIAASTAIGAGPLAGAVVSPWLIGAIEQIGAVYRENMATTSATLVGRRRKSDDAEARIAAALEDGAIDLEALLAALRDGDLEAVRRLLGAVVDDSDAKRLPGAHLAYR